MKYSVHLKEIRDKKKIIEFLAKHATEVRPASFCNTRIDFQSQKGITEIRQLAQQIKLACCFSRVSDAAYGVG